MADTEDRDTFRVERTTVIDAAPERVYERIVDFHRWVDWSPWEGIDPDLRRTYTGPESGAGSVYEWEGSRKVGKGRMEILGAEAPKDVDIDLQFIKPFKAQNRTRFALRPEGSGTRVVWTMTGRKTLMTKVMGVFTSMDKMVGKDFEKGLSQLKALAER